MTSGSSPDNSPASFRIPVNSLHHRNLTAKLGFICLEYWATRAAASDVSALRESKP